MSNYGFVGGVLIAILGWIGFLKLLNHKALLFPTSWRPWIHWLYAMTIELLIFAACFFLRPFGYLANQDKSVGSSVGRPILLVHGYLHDSSAWTYMKQKLASEGFGPIYTLNLIHPFRSIRSYAQFVAKKAEKIAEATGRKDLILVGHSMGGLVSSWYATKLAPPGTVTDVITLGSPLRGTYVAWIALGPNGSEMRPGSEFIKELQTEIARSQDIRFYHIGTKTDQLVIPSSSAWLGDRKEKHFVVEDMGHVTLLFSKRVSKKTCQWLLSGLN